jgi:glycosyltransferase involved in cell wall biosynthesis/peptidoglycan/xylan/chitin deacetylase (PgdA/CDA1 family)
VVIPTRNRRTLLIQTLKSLADQDFPTSRFEVIVVIDGGTDDSDAALKALPLPVALHVIHQSHQGQAAARNRGVALASGTWILFLNDDMECPPDLLTRHVALHQQQPGGVVFGGVTVPEVCQRSIAAKWQAKISEEAIERFEASERIAPQQNEGDLDPNSSLSRALFLDMKGFDELLRNALETAELAWRLRQKGVAFRYLPGTPVSHLYQKPTNVVAVEEAINLGRTEYRFCHLHPEWRPQSGLVHLASAGLIKNATRYILSSTPGVNALFSFLLGLLEQERAPAITQRFSLWLFNCQRRVNYWRGARLAAGSWRTLLDEFGTRISVLLYHRIGPEMKDTFHDLSVSTARFAKQMRWLKRLGPPIISAETLIAWREGKVRLPRRAVLITFDDAYADTATEGFPILESMGIPSLCFAVSGLTGRHNVWDTDKGSVPIPLMNATQLRHWSDRGVSFGAHSRTHQRLPSLRASDQIEEITGSGVELSRELARPVRSFAYPYGEADAHCQSLVRRHFVLGFSTEEGLNTLNVDRAHLRRSMVYPHDGPLAIYCRARLGRDPVREFRGHLSRWKQKVRQHL